MKPTQEEIDKMVEMLNVYNNAKTAEEGFGALSGIIKIGEKLLDKDET